MNRSEIHETVRRRIQEEEPDYFTNQRINTIINEALGEVQLAVLGSQPEAFVVVDLAPIVAAQEAYGFPANMLYPIALEILDASSSTYSKVEKRAYEIVRGYNLGQNPYAGPTVYAQRGRDFILSPIPSAAIVQGLRLTHVDILTVDEDDDVPELPITLHKYICAKAAALCLIEMGEDPSEQEALFAIGMQLIPKLYRSSADAPQKMNPQTPNVYPSSGSGIPRGTDSRR